VSDSDLACSNATVRVEADYEKGLLNVRVREVGSQAVEPAKIQIRNTAPALESTEAK
jgi:HSP20 family molecular chaperone IbpA